MEIDRVTALVEGTVEKDPLPFDLYVGFIDPPAGAKSRATSNTSGAASPSPVHNANPSVVDIDAALIKRLLQVR